MDDAQTTPINSGKTEPTSPTVEVRGLGFALSAAALRMLLDPATRDQAEVVVDLSRLSIDVPADAARNIALQVEPDLTIALARDEMSIRLPGNPAVRVALPRAGVRVRVGAEGIRIGGDESTGDA
jgi:hypothetical protein